MTSITTIAGSDVVANSRATINTNFSNLNTGKLEVSSLLYALFAAEYSGADIGAQINAAYAALPSSGGAIVVPGGTYSFSTPIVFNTSGKYVSLIGLSGSGTYLKYTPTSGNAITMNCGNPTGHTGYEITGFTLMGKSSLIAAGQTNTNTSVGIYYGGTNGAVGINTHDMNVNGFGSNWEIASNAYMLSFAFCSNSGGNGGQASRGSLVHINAASNSGEANNFTICKFTDPGNSDATNAIYITNAGTASNVFYGGSMDNAQLLVGASNGATNLYGVHIENPGAPSSYPEYIPILGVSSDSSTSINLHGVEFANSASNRTWTTLVRHGGQFSSVGSRLDNYNGSTVTNFVLHDLNNGTSSDTVSQTQVQGGALTNIVGGSGGVTHSRATGVSTMMNVANSYSIGLRPQGSNTNEFYSGNSTTGTYDHSGNWTFLGKITSYNGISTAGWGLTPVQGSGRATGQTAANASVATYTVGGSDGSFTVSANVNVTTATTHNFTVTCTYTDETNASRTVVFPFSQQAGERATAITNTTGTGPYHGYPQSIRAKAGTTITIGTTGTFTTVTYNVEGSIIQVA